MRYITISFNKAGILREVETLLYKYGSTIEGADNFKQVYNVKSNSAEATEDAQLMTASFKKMAYKFAGVAKEFLQGPISEITSGNETTGYSMTLALSDNWGSSAPMLQQIADKYVEDGMMADWLKVTAPNEAALYSVALKQDEGEIITELYAVGGAI